MWLYNVEIHNLITSVHGLLFVIVQIVDSSNQYIPVNQSLTYFSDEGHNFVKPRAFFVNHSSYMIPRESNNKLKEKENYHYM
jgi:hypothetical protein